MDIKVEIEFNGQFKSHIDLYLNNKIIDFNEVEYVSCNKIRVDVDNTGLKNLSLKSTWRNRYKPLTLVVTITIEGKIYKNFILTVKKQVSILNIEMPGLKTTIIKGALDDFGIPFKKNRIKELGFQHTKNVHLVKDPQQDYSYFHEENTRDSFLAREDGKVDNTLVEVFYATNRKQKIVKNKRITYTNSRGNNISIGKCIVNVPGKREKGQFPLSKWYHLWNRNNEDKFIIIRNVEKLTPEIFFEQIRTKISLSPEKDAFLFVHGYNVSFTESVARAAQLCVDIGFNGAPIVYSWPSKGKIFGYFADESTNTGYSTRDIVELLKKISENGVERLHIIAHSMGNRLIADALRTLVDQGFGKQFKFNQIILAAPDIDGEVFVKEIAPRIVECTNRVTLYASKKDIALRFSKKLHGNILRAGGISDEVVIAEGVDTIDTSREATDFLGHGYFARSKSLIDDIFHVIRFGTPPKDRNLKEKTIGHQTYWEFW